MNKYFNGYNKEKAIAMHNVREEHLKYLETYILEWTDSIPVKGECKLENLFVELQHDYFFITSTFTLDEWLIEKPNNVKQEFKRRFVEMTVEELQEIIYKEWGKPKNKYILPDRHV